MILTDYEIRPEPSNIIAPKSLINVINANVNPLCPYASPILPGLRGDDPMHTPNQRIGIINTLRRTCHDRRFLGLVNPSTSRIARLSDGRGWWEEEDGKYIRVTRYPGMYLA